MKGIVTKLMKLTQEQLTDLAVLQTVTLDNGLIVKYRTEPDNDMSVNEWDCYGKVAPRETNRYSGRKSERPEEFNGSAEIIHTQFDEFWWQPPTDLKATWKKDMVQYRAMRQSLHDILQWGFDMYFVEICQGTDAYGHDIVLDYGVLGCVEPMIKDEYKIEILRDVLADIEMEVTV